MGQNLNFFYQTTNIFLSNFKSISDDFAREIIIPLEKFKSKIHAMYISILKEYQVLSAKYDETKKKVIKIQKKYFSLSNNLSNINKEKSPDLYLKAKAEADACSMIYRYEISNANNLYKQYDKEYFNFYDKIKANEENRLMFIRNCIEKYLEASFKINTSQSELITQISSKISLWKKEQDLELFEEEFNFSSSDNDGTIVRFPKEIFYEYAPLITPIKDSPKGYGSGLLSKGKQIISFLGDYENIDKVQNENYQKSLITQFMKFIDGNDDITIEIITQINRLVLQNPDFSLNFIKEYLKSHKEFYYEVKNNKNFLYFSNIIMVMLLFSGLDNDDTANLANAIISISQRTYTQKDKKPFNLKSTGKIFLCSLLGRSPIFKSSSFWRKVIEFKLKLKLQQISSKTMKKYEEYRRKVQSESYYNSSTIMTSPTSSNSYSITGGFGFIGSGIKNFFKMETIDNKIISISKIDQPQKKKKINEFVKLCEFSSIYQALPLFLQNEFNGEAYQELNRIIKDTIPSFINLNFGLNNSLDFLIAFCEKYEVNNKLVNFYMICLNSSSFSTKQYCDNFYEDKSFRLNIDNLRIGRKESIIPKYQNNEEIRKTKEKEKLFILNSITPFLTFKDKVSFLLLSKAFLKPMKKKIYKDILFNSKTFPLTTRLEVWKSLLKVNEIKKECIYSECLKKVKEIKYDRFSNLAFSIIDLDVQRTTFKTNITESRKAIENVLKTIAYLFPKVSYCQGMNFIASFLYKLTSNETETFYILFGLIKNTKFSNIFYDDLRKLKRNFIIFEKILCLYLPVTSMFFKSNNIETNYYLSAWFITLFTSTVSQSTPIGSVISIWDAFLIGGWKTMFNIALGLIELQEETIITLKPEPLLHFLSGDLIKLTLFNESDELIFLISHWKIKNKLIHNIKRELIHESELSEEKSE